MLFGYYVIYRNPPKSMDELAEKAVGLLLIFFLTRSWLSEPNINLLLPLMLIVVGSGRVSYHSFHLAWIIPLMFMFLNMAVPQLFFLAYPSSIPAIAAFDSRYETARFVARYIVTILWFVFAVKIAKSTIKVLTKENLVSALYLIRNLYFCVVCYFRSLLSKVVLLGAKEKWAILMVSK